jgi:hypothetical protein
VVERAKKCLDFACTLYLLHLLCCCAYRGALLRLRFCAHSAFILRSFRAHARRAAGWPRSFGWWAVNAVGLVVMTVLGCARARAETATRAPKLPTWRALRLLTRRARPRCAQRVAVPAARDARDSAR